MPVATARMARRRTLALRVFGSASVKRTADGSERRAQLLGDARRAARRATRRRRRRPAAATTNTHNDSPFTVVGHADRGRFQHRGMADDHRLDLGRPEALARDLDGVVGAAVQEPLPVGADASRSRRATTRPATGTSTSRDSARGRATTRVSFPATASCTRAHRRRRAPGARRRRTRRRPSRARGRRANTATTVARRAATGSTRRPRCRPRC